ncbi:hypothetical protein [Pandoraea bronchicola]|uniref:hypothetical protein n=1 Tax=Pandoraea bronchicola TaxID=2508287 RepID=UPI00123F3E10|nr:hypothetical protein [Pandoraea bronchicola]
MSLTPLSPLDSTFARHASSIAARSSSRVVDTRLPPYVWWVAISVLALHWLVWIAAPAPLADLSENGPERKAMQVTIVTPPAPRGSALQPPSLAESPRKGEPASAVRTPAPPQRITSPSAKPAEPQVSPAPALSAPALDWRADIAREAGAPPASKASSPVASAERAVTNQSQRATPHDKPPAQGNVAQRAFEREFGSGQASVSGPQATREGGNPLGTTECIEMNGKRVCTRQRNLAGDIDPFMKRERIFSPVMR